MNTYTDTPNDIGLFTLEMLYYYEKDLCDNVYNGKKIYVTEGKTEISEIYFGKDYDINKISFSSHSKIRDIKYIFIKNYNKFIDVKYDKYGYFETEKIFLYGDKTEIIIVAYAKDGTEKEYIINIVKVPV